MDLNKIIKTRLNILMEECDIKQVELANKANLTEVSVSRYLQGHRIPTVENLVKMAKVLNTSTDYLVGLTSTPEPVDADNTDKILMKIIRKKLQILYRELECLITLGSEDSKWKIVM